MTDPVRDVELDELREARAARLAVLEARARARRPLGVRPPLALAGVLLSLVLLGPQWRDVAYLFASREPVSLGSEGAYRLERLASNRYAQVRGRPLPVAAWGVDAGRVVVMVGLEGTPLVVRRAPVAGESWEEGEPPPPPDATPFAVRGRLLREDHDPRFAQGYARLRASGLLRPDPDGHLWVLVEGERPGEDRATALLAGLLAALLLLTLWMLARAVGDRRARTG